MDVPDIVVASREAVAREALQVLVDRFPGLGPDGCIEFTSLINIRPAHGNRSMEIQDEQVRARVRDLTFRLIGRGEVLS